MSYLKLNKNKLSFVKDELNNCYTSLEDSVKEIGESLPEKRDLSIDLSSYIEKEGIDYTKIGTEYNNAIDTINDNVNNSTFLHDLKSIIKDINSIIKTVDEYNSVDYTNYESRMAALHEELLFLEDLGLEQEEKNTEVEEQPIEDIVEVKEETIVQNLKEEPTEEKEEEFIQEQKQEEDEDKPVLDNNIDIIAKKTEDNKEEVTTDDLFTKIKWMSNNGVGHSQFINKDKSEYSKKKIDKVLDEDNTVVNYIDLTKDDDEDIDKKEVNNTKEKDKHTNSQRVDINKCFYPLLILIIGVTLLIGLSLVNIISTFWLVILSILMLIIILVYIFYDDKEDKKE